MLIVLETLTPAERLTFVLHDMVAVPFEQIAPIVERSPEATRQLTSRARRRVRGAAPVPDANLHAQWEVVEAFQAAAQKGWERQVDLILRRALINGVPGVVATRDGRPFSVGAFTVKNGKIVEIDFLADPERIARLDLTVLGEEHILRASGRARTHGARGSPPR